MSNVMIDIETLGTESNSVIFSLGAAKFNSKGANDTFYRVIDIETCTKYGLVINGSTVQWWMGQSEEARKVFKEKGDSLFNVLSDFSKFIDVSAEGKNKIKVWGNGSDFDNVILANAYSAVNLPLPWKFWNNRCYRTMKNIFSGVPFNRAGTHHNALDDAVSQAEHLVEIMGHVKGEK